MPGGWWFAACLVTGGMPAGAVPGTAVAPDPGPGIDGRRALAAWTTAGIELAATQGADAGAGGAGSSVQAWPVNRVLLGPSGLDMGRLGGQLLLARPGFAPPLRGDAAPLGSPAEAARSEPRSGAGWVLPSALAWVVAMLLIAWRARGLHRRAAGPAQRLGSEAVLPGDVIVREPPRDEAPASPLDPHLLMQNLQSAIAAAARGHCLLGLLCISPQRFQWVSERFGSAAGEQLLHAVAERLQAGIAGAGEGAAGASLVRGFSGGQFVVVLPALQSAAAAFELAHRLLQGGFGRPFELEGRVFGCGAGIGVAIWPEDGETADALLARAEVAMHQARLDGRNGVLQYTPALDGPSRRRSEIAGMLIAAREEGRLRLRCQPIVNLIGGEVIGYEAQIRVVDPSDGSLVGPAEFFPVAEALGVIHGTGLWAIDAALRLIREWPTAHPRWPVPQYVSLRVSHLQLMREGFPKQLRQLLLASGVAPYRLVLEIGEARLPEATEEMLSCIRWLHELGVSLAIKNFSAGSASLTSLKRFPFSMLKIDRGIVHGLGIDPTARQTVAAIIAVAAVYDLCIVAEGVENRAQASVLRELQAQGSLCAQGFLYGGPAEVPATPAALAAVP